MEFNSADELWAYALGQLLRGERHNSRAGATREILGASLTLSNIDRNFVLNADRCLDPAYACAELLWYLSGSDDVSMIAAYAPHYRRFADGDTAAGAYGKRWWADPAYRQRKPNGPGQLEDVMRLLTLKPETRQAVMVCWNAGDLVRAVDENPRDVPCTLSLQFLVRGGFLHAIITMRSEDAWLGLPYDLFAFSSLQQIIAQSLGLNLGRYVHQVGSLHLYSRDAERATGAALAHAVQEALDRGRHLTHAVTRSRFSLDSSINSALSAERVARERQTFLSATVDLPSSLLTDVANLCACYWTGVSVTDAVSSLLLKEAYHANYRGARRRR